MIKPFWEGPEALASVSVPSQAGEQPQTVNPQDGAAQAESCKSGLRVDMVAASSGLLELRRQGPARVPRLHLCPPTCPSRQAHPQGSAPRRNLTSPQSQRLGSRRFQLTVQAEPWNHSDTGGSSGGSHSPTMGWCRGMTRDLQSYRRDQRKKRNN